MRRLLFVITVVVLAFTAQVVQAQSRARYKIHETPATKKIIVDGGVRFMGYFCEGLSVVGGKNDYFVINKNGVKVFSIPQGYVPCKMRDSNEGFIGFSDNRLMIYSESKKRAIVLDNTGKTIKEFSEIHKASAFSSGVALLLKKEKLPGRTTSSYVWHHIDINGNTLSKTMSVSADDVLIHFRLFGLADGLARVRDDGTKKWGFRNKLCQWVIKPTFKKVHAFSEGLAAACSDEGRWGFIDKMGGWVIPPTYSIETGDFTSGFAMVIDKQNNRYFIDKTGKIVWKRQYDSEEIIRPFTTSGYAVWTFGNDSYIVDTSFKRKIKIDIDYSGGSSGISAESSNWIQWWTSWSQTNRIIDWNGNLLLEFDGNRAFTEGICAMEPSRENGGYYFNEKGEIIVKFEDTIF